MPVGYRHDRQAVLDAAVELARASGLHGLTFRSVGRRAGVADRTVVYYFPSKERLVQAVLHQATAELVQLLAHGVGDGARSVDDLLRASWSALRHPDADQALRLYVETLGMAARGGEPYRSIVTGLTESWTAWLADRLAIDDGERDDRAAALLATLDGLLLLSVTAGPEATAAAARGLGLEA